MEQTKSSEPWMDAHCLHWELGLNKNREVWDLADCM